VGGKGNNRKGGRLRTRQQKLDGVSEVTKKEEVRQARVVGEDYRDVDREKFVRVQDQPMGEVVETDQLKGGPWGGTRTRRIIESPEGHGGGRS